MRHVAHRALYRNVAPRVYSCRNVALACRTPWTSRARPVSSAAAVYLILVYNGCAVHTKDPYIYGTLSATFENIKKYWHIWFLLK
jgi:hypothetical protein